MSQNSAMRDLVRTMGQAAKQASLQIGASSTEVRNKALRLLADKIRTRKEAIFKANELDLNKAAEHDYPTAFIDRLRLTPAIVETMALGCEQIADLPDPIGQVTEKHHRPSGIDVARMRVPLGVIAIIFESRPNVTIDTSALTIKSGNAAILRGGKEALESNRMLGALVQEALDEAGLPQNAVQVVGTPDRDFVGELITSPEYIDVLIPRGGKKLISRLEKESRIPMIKHLDGICHTYVDKDANLAMAVSVTDNAKTQRYAPCNATETLLVHEAVAEAFLPQIGKIFADKGVQMRGTEAIRNILAKADLPSIPATDQDWDTEYNAPIISIATVKSLTEAIDFINRHGSKHTDAIITDNPESAARFLREVDSGSVMHNCSTRLADGFVYGLGAEIGISNGKLHARGPVGLEGLTSLKFVVYGHGEGRH